MAFFFFFPFKTLLLSQLGSSMFLSSDSSFASHYPDFWSPFQRDAICSSMGDGGRGAIGLQKHYFLVTCILTNAQFVAVPSQVEPTEGERIYLILKETINHSELSPFCTWNYIRGPLIVCQLLWFQKESSGANGDQTSCWLQRTEEWKILLEGWESWDNLAVKTGCLELIQNGTASVWLSSCQPCLQCSPGLWERKWGVREGGALNFQWGKGNEWVHHYWSILLKYIIFPQL